MKRSSRFRSIWITVVVILFCGLAYSLAYAWTCNQPNSTVCPCNCASRVNIVGLGIVNISTNGSMTLRCEDSGPTLDGRDSNTFTSTGFVASGTDPIAGTINIQIDPLRIPSYSTLVSNIPNVDWPATCDVYAYCTMTISSQPGTIYRSIGQFHMHSATVGSFSPSHNEPYVLAEPVSFEKDGQPGLVAATLESASITVGPE